MRFQFGPKHPNWNGGRTVDVEGYIRIKMWKHPYHDSRGYIKEHRLVMENKIGRYLRPDEDVHHINGNRQDNRIDNLQLLSHGEHNRHHKLKNKSDWECCICESKDTNDWGGWPHWNYIGDNRVCSKCYSRVYYHRND